MKALVSEIRRKVKTRDNGPAVDTMRKLGISHKTIHGLSIAEIKNISEPYQYNNDLALELWSWDNREFKILASFIADPKSVSMEQLESWAADLKDSELAEQLAINLAFKTNKADVIVPLWLKSENLFTQKAALVLLAWTAQRGANVNELFLSKQVKDLKDLVNNNLQLTKGISFAYRAIGKRNKALNKLVIQEVNTLKSDDSNSAKYIVEDVLWELESDIIQDRLI